MKTCTKCSCTKEPSEFYARPRSPDGREAWCKVCRLAHNKEWRDRNPERQKELVDRRYEENKEVISAKFKVKYEANKAYYLAKYYLRLHKIRRATPKWAVLSEIVEIYKQARDCSEFVGMKYEVDHIVPINGKTVCGLHVACNLRIITAKENRTKSNTTWPDKP